MTKLIDGAFASLGLLSIFVYGGLLATGSSPERALLVALGGGLAVGVLLHFVLTFVQLEAEDAETPSEAATGAATAATKPDSAAAASSSKAPAPQGKLETNGRLQEQAA